MDQQFDLIVVGSCVQDLVSYTPRFPNPGESVRGSKFLNGFGGKGANQAVQAARLGANVAMVGMVGKDIFGPPTIENFKKNKINADFVKLSETSTTATATITVTDSGQNSIVVVLGANMDLSVDDVKAAESLIKRSKVMACQLEINPDVTLEALRLAKKHNVITIFNPAPGLPNLNMELLKYSDIICPNENEAELLSGMKFTCEQDTEKMLAKFLDCGAATAVITLGDKGCYYATRNDRSPKKLTAESVKAVDTTGAGDSFVGSLAYFTAQFPNMSLDERLKRACRIATTSVLKHGTQTSYPNRDQLPQDLFTEN